MIKIFLLGVAVVWLKNQGVTGDEFQGKMELDEIDVQGDYDNLTKKMSQVTKREPPFHDPSEEAIFAICGDYVNYVQSQRPNSREDEIKGILANYEKTFLGELHEDRPPEKALKITQRKFVAYVYDIFDNGSVNPSGYPEETLTRQARNLLLFTAYTALEDARNFLIGVFLAVRVQDIDFPVDDSCVSLVFHLLFIPYVITEIYSRRAKCSEYGSYVMELRIYMNDMEVLMRILDSNNDQGESALEFREPDFIDRCLEYFLTLCQNKNMPPITYENVLDSFNNNNLTMRYSKLESYLERRLARGKKTLNFSQGRRNLLKNFPLVKKLWDSSNVIFEACASNFLEGEFQPGYFFLLYALRQIKERNFDVRSCNGLQDLCSELEKNSKEARLFHFSDIDRDVPFEIPFSDIKE